MKDFMIKHKTDLFYVGLFLLVLILFRLVIINAYIPSESMENTLMTKDRIIGLRLTKEFKRGDVAIFHYDEDRAYKESYEFMLGRDILVAPVVRDNSQNRVLYLPNDEWVHIWSGKEYKGGKHTVYSPVGQPPVFVRKSSEKFDELMNIVK